MNNKSDNAADYGIHLFTKSVGAQGPFECVGYHRAAYQACQGAPIQPGGCCAHCGTGIYECFVIQGTTPTTAGHKTFIVGSTCVMKTGDAGLIRAYKTHPEYRAAMKKARAAKDAANTEAWNAMVNDEATAAKLNAHTIEAFDFNARVTVTKPWLQHALNAWRWCGAAGRARYVKAARAILAE